MRLRIYTAALSCLAGLVMLSPTAASAKILQQHHLVATPEPQSWKSRPVQGTVYAHVFMGKLEVAQDYLGNIARYQALGATITVRAIRASAPGAHPLLVHFRSSVKHRPFRIVIATTPSL